ncbi:plasmid mobilization relaxosome protein MobC [Streptococcus parauberis]|uniref:Plasmid mobilization relaxosome protein MobC n=1 Tax=Streptococcus parauberis TaxID=1348 RepID=A0AAE4L4M1_9STRE|nr:plasmid mobilization relaxosome protein MobC [Streptococcus parauberis]MDT2732538.1 plasmid mobilization relaxosome protein MobC [Streptococcus parauberis]
MIEEKRYREIQKKIRVTPEENELIKRRMANHHFKNINTYARYMLLTGEIVMVDYSELIKLRTEINRIGTNINQLAKFVNTTEEFTLENYQILQDALVSVKQLMDDNFDKEITIFEKQSRDRRG